MKLFAISLAVSLATWQAPAFSAATPAPLKQQAAVPSAGALRSSILAVARAGNRIVAVGDRGVVLLSDDNGATFRQSSGVPTRAMLNAVSFAPDGRTGWAAGHLGVVLVTHDAGSTWRLQREDTSTDQPLFTTRFSSIDDGFAAGLWSLLLRTRNGGTSWEPIRLAAAAGSGKTEGAGPNLFSLSASAKGTLLIASEQGVIYRSTDAGSTWAAIQTDSKGTFWVCASLKSGSLLAAGVGGKIYRSSDDGQTWSASTQKGRSSITAITQLPSRRVVAVGLDGAVMSSADDGLTFESKQLPARTDLTAVLATGNDTALYMSTEGPLSPARSVAMPSEPR